MNSPVARLDVVTGKAAGMSIVVEDELLIGRHADGAGRLAEDDEISRSHARLTLESAGFCAIEDLGSTNGTFVNGLRISGPQTLSEGDSIEVGGTMLVVRELPAAAIEQTRRVVPPQPTIVPSESVAPTMAGPEDGAGGSADGVGGAADGPVAPGAAGSADGPREPETHLDATARYALDVPLPASGVLALRIEVDFAAREATIALGDGAEPLKLVFDDGVWRPAPASN
jgi:pSer/pThr/pTyr-binding forkhead associated (FHA) protein